MSTSREIRSKINSVKSTQKITRAMEMVAASKMRKAQDRMFATRPYALKIRDVIGHLAKSHPEFRHIFFEERPIKRAGIIIVTTDRGLCGSLNVNLLKTSIEQINTWQQQDAEVDLCLLGHKAEAFFKRFGGNIKALATHIGDQPTLKDLIGIVKVMLDAYSEKKLDALHIVYNEFVNTMIQKPKVEQILPLVPDTSDRLDYYWDYIYEPDARDVLNQLLTRYVEAEVYQSVVENIASEQAARMVAMRNASENASQLIDDLQLAYNKARQAAITAELADIIAGAEAISNE